MKIETVEDLQNLRYGVIGAGALGGFYGSMLCKNGYNTALLMRSAAEDVKKNGLSVDSIWGKWQVQPKVFSSPKEMGICDILIIGLKTISNSSLKEIFEYTVGPNTIIMTLQNGLGNEEYIESVLPDNSATPEVPRVLGGCSFVCCWREGNNKINHTSGGNIEFAELDGKLRPRTTAICEMLKSIGIPCTIKSSPADVRWHKLIWNIPFNGMGLVAHADTAAVMESPELLATARRLMAEIQRVAAKDGIDITDKFCEWQFERTSIMGHYKSSMQIDYENRRQAEVEAILGEPVRRAKKLGVEVPLMEMLYGEAKRLNLLNIQQTN